MTLQKTPRKRRILWGEVIKLTLLSILPGGIILAAIRIFTKK